MKITAAMLKRIAKGTPNNANVNSVVVALDRFGTAAGLDLPHRLMPFIATCCVESGSFKYDREIWGPTPAQKKYDTGKKAKDLGNTPAADGDGKKRAGRGPFQLTGGANEKAFTLYARTLDPNAPDFYANPDAINTDPWEGLSAIWFWDKGNQTGRSLNNYADRNDVEMIRRKVNGGLNGYDVFLDYCDRAAFVMLGYALGAYKQFQTDARKKWGYTGKIDNAAGPQTRAAMFRALVALGQGNQAMPEETAASPVMETKEVSVEVEKKVAVEVPKPVVTKDLDKAWYKDLLGQKELATTAVVPAVTAVTGAPWETVAVIGLLCIIGIGVYYVIRRRDAAKQQAAVEAVHADAAVAKAEIAAN